MLRLQEKGPGGTEAHVVSFLAGSVGYMVVTFRYRLLPTKAQHHALEQILESQRQLYNAPEWARVCVT